MDTGNTAIDHHATTYITTAKLPPIDENADVNFEVPPGEVESFSKPKYRACITVRVTKYVVHATTL